MWVKRQVYEINIYFKEYDDEGEEVWIGNDNSDTFYAQTYKEALEMQEDLLAGKDSYYGDLVKECIIRDEMVTKEFWEDKNTMEEINSFFEFIIDDTQEIEGHLLHRIVATKNFGDVKMGDLGGYIEKEDNLIHNKSDSIAWVYDNAKVFGEATIRDNAKVKDNATVRDNALICYDVQILNNAVVKDQANVSGHAIIRDFACIEGATNIFSNVIVQDSAIISGNAMCFDRSKISGQALVKDSARIRDTGSIEGNAVLEGNAEVQESAKVCGAAVISGNAVIKGAAIVSDKAKVFGNAHVMDDAKVIGNAIVTGNAMIFLSKCIGQNQIIKGNFPFESMNNNIKHTEIRKNKCI